MSPVDFTELAMIRTSEKMAKVRIHPLLYYEYPIDYLSSIICEDINRALDDLAVMIGAKRSRIN